MKCVKNNAIDSMARKLVPLECATSQAQLLKFKFQPSFCISVNHADVWNLVVWMQERKTSLDRYLASNHEHCHILRCHKMRTTFSNIWRYKYSSVVLTMLHTLWTVVFDLMFYRKSRVTNILVNNNHLKLSHCQITVRKTAPIYADVVLAIKRCTSANN